MNDTLKALFNPKTIAVIGASTKPNKLGRLIYDNIKKHKFSGKVWPVNVKGGYIGQDKIYKTLEDIDYKIDLAIIVIPAVFVPQVVKQAVDLKVKSLIVISAGFKETGPQGQVLEAKIKNVLKDSQTRLLGVNCLGLISQESSLNATFVKAMPKTGKIAFMSQSGAFGAAVLDKFENFPYGLKYFVSLGNKTDINELDLIKYWQTDDQIQVILAYLESLENGQAFIQLARQTSLKKPIIILMPGRSTAGQKAVSSHTGSLVKSTQVIDLILAKAGTIQVKNIDQLFTYTSIFAAFGQRRSSQDLFIITNAGGPAILTTDLAIKHGFKIKPPRSSCQKSLKAKLPIGASSHNPIDVLGDAPADRYQAASQILLDNYPEAAYFFILTPQITTQPNETAQIIINQFKNRKNPVLTFLLGGKQVAEAKNMLNRHQLPAFDTIETPIRALAAWYSWQKQQAKPRLATWPKFKLSQQLTDKINLSHGHLDPSLAAEVIYNLNLKLPTSLYHPLSQIPFGQNLNQVAKIISQRWPAQSYPAVVKLVSKEFSHSTDLKGVYLNLKDKKHLSLAIAKLLKIVQVKKLNRQQSYICIQKQIGAGLEMIAGFKHYPDFGFAFVFGSGGILTEIYHDIQTILLPTNPDEIKLKLSQTKIYRLLTGFRGSTAYNIDQVVKTLYNLTGLPSVVPGLVTADFNPLIINHKGVWVVDVEIFKDDK